MFLVLGLALMAAPASVQLCVQAQGSGLPSQEELLRALRARLPSGAEVETCNPTADAWQLFFDGQARDVTVRASHLDQTWETRVARLKLSTAETAAMLALAAVELVRRDLESLLATLAVEANKVAKPNQAPGPPPAVVPTAAPPMKLWEFYAGLGLAGLLGFDPQHRLASPSIQVGARWHPWTAGLGFESSSLGARQRYGLDFEGRSYTLSLAVGVVWQRFSATVAPLWRVTRLSLGGRAAQPHPTFHDTGVGLNLGITLWQWRRLSLGGTLHGRLYQQPRRFVVDSGMVYTQSLTELGAGVSLGMSF